MSDCPLVSDRRTQQPALVMVAVCLLVLLQSVPEQVQELELGQEQEQG